MEIILSIIFSVIVLFIIGMESDRKENHSKSGSSVNNKVPQETYWESYQNCNPHWAKEIQSLYDHDISTLPENDAYQVVALFTRWSKNTGVPILELKNNFLKQVQSFISEGIPYDVIISKCKENIAKEARLNHVEEKYTISNVTLGWLLKMKEEESADSYSNSGSASNSESELKQFVLLTFRGVVLSPLMKRYMSKDSATVFSDVIINMIHSGEIDDQIRQKLPPTVINQITVLIKMYNNPEISQDDFDEVLGSAQQEFVEEFSN